MSFLWPGLFNMDHLSTHICPSHKCTHKSKTFLKNKRKEMKKNRRRRKQKGRQLELPTFSERKTPAKKDIT